MNHNKSELDMLKQISRTKLRLQALMNQIKEEETKSTHPKAQMLYGTTAEVLGSLTKAFDHFEKETEASWHTAGQADTSSNAWPQQEAPLK